MSLPLADAAISAPSPLARARALMVFSGAARRLLIDLKYHGLVRAGTLVGRRMAAARGAETVLAGADVIAPVPLHWRRRWRRGYNQAAVLGAAMARCRSDVVFVPLLVRRRATVAQVGLDQQGRRDNVAGAFRCSRRRRQRIAGATIVLVDDVITTGATAAACASVLTRAGAREVRLYAAAWAMDGCPGLTA